jgi:phage terminase Nu1 subunit (DNA packaging protein)
MLNQILEALATAFVAILLAVISYLAAKVTSYLSAKKAAIIAKAGADKYNAELTVSQSVFDIVNEAVRTTPALQAISNQIQLKINMFQTEILKKCPYLTQEEIDHLRQAVAGAVNEGKDVILAPVKEVLTAPTNNTLDAPQI